MMTHVIIPQEGQKLGLPCLISQRRTPCVGEGFRCLREVKDVWIGSLPQSWRKVTGQSLCLICTGELGLVGHLRRVCTEFREVIKKGFAADACV